MLMASSRFFNYRVSLVALLISSGALIYGVFSFTRDSQLQRKLESIEPIREVFDEKECKREFMFYNSSELEKIWIEGISDWELFSCKKSLEQQMEIHDWVDTISKNRDPSPLKGRIFSWFTFRVKCPDREDRIVEEVIEPLASVIRDPRGVCAGFPHADIGSLGFLVLAKSIHKNENLVLFDFGASVWGEGAGRSSQDWFYENYPKRGFKFEGMYCFEASKHTDTKIYGRIPHSLRPVYHYYNVPISSRRNELYHGWSFVQTTLQKHSKNTFVSVKLDIDNTPVETELVNQLLNKKGLDGKLHEFFFEHHTYLPEMLKHWQTHNEKSRLSHSYKIFHKLRNLGVRAHGWP
jgi:hypothetical protein